MSLTWNGQWDDPRLDVEFKNDVQGIFGPDEDNWGIDEPAVRDEAKQNSLYAEGRDANGNIVNPDAVVTYAKWPQGPHCWGLAVDPYRIVGSGITAKRVWDYDNPAWARIRAKVDAHPRLHGGWKFPHPDPDHIEAYPKWRDKKAALIASGQWDNPTSTGG